MLRLWLRRVITWFGRLGVCSWCRFRMGWLERFLFVRCRFRGRLFDARLVLPVLAGN